MPPVRGFPRPEGPDDSPVPRSHIRELGLDSVHDIVVAGARGEPPAVRTEGDAEDPEALAVKHPEQAARRRVPKPDCPLLAAAGEDLAIGAERHRPDGDLVAVRSGRSGRSEHPRSGGLVPDAVAMRVPLGLYAIACVT